MPRQQPAGYRLDIEFFFPGDNGNIGDYTEETLSSPTPLRPSGELGLYPGRHVRHRKLRRQQGDTVAIVLSYCDSWCDTESRITVTGPGGINDEFFPLGYQPSDVGTIVTSYTTPGTYTLSVDDPGWGDGGIGADAVLTMDAGNVTGLFQTDGFDLEAESMGIVTDTTDEQDVWAVFIPEGYLVDVTLSWDNSADLDLALYGDYALTDMIDDSIYNNPELVTSTDQDWDDIAWIEVVWWSGFGVSDAIYTLTVDFIPVSGVPCYNEDDGGSPDTYYNVFTGDAGHEDIPSTKVIDTSAGSGTIRGMICGGYDDIDAYNFTVAPETGIFATLVFDDEHDYDMGFDLSKEIAATPGTWTSIDEEMNAQDGMRSVTSNLSYNWGPVSLGRLRCTTRSATDGTATQSTSSLMAWSSSTT